MLEGRGLLDIITGIVFLLALIILYVIIPLALGYLLYKHRWMSPKLRRFFAYVIFVQIAGILLMIVIRLLR